MVEEVESLVLEASVVDDFSRTLDELSSELAGIAAQEEQVDPIEIDTHVASALAELEAVEQQLNRIDRKDVNVDIDTDRDIPAMWAQDMGAIPGTPNYDRVMRQTRNVDDDASILPTSRRNDAGALNSAMRRAMFGTDDVMDLPNMDAAGGVVGDRRGPFSRIFRNFRRDMSEAVGEFADLRLSMGILMNIMASLVPLLVVFVGALPSAIAGLGALAAAGLAAAGALAGVVGLGLGAMLFEGGELNVAEAQQHLQELLDTFLEAFGPLMEAMRPVAETLFREAEFLIRDMAVALEGLIDMTGDANAAIEWVADVMAAATAEAVAFAEAAMPVMSFIVGGLAGIDWFGIFADVIADTLPLLTEFAATIMRMAPVIYELSLGFFEVTNSIFLLFAVLWTLVDIFPGLAEAMGTVISLLLVAVTASALYSLATSTVISRVTGAIATLGSYAAATLIAISQTYGMAAAFLAAAAAAAAFYATITLGLSLLTSAVGGAVGLQTEVGGAADEMRRFANQSRRANVPGQSRSGAGGGPSYGGFGSSGSTTVVAPDKETGNAVATSLSFNGEGSATTEQSDVENRQHSGDN